MMTASQTDRQRDRQAGRQADRHTHTHKVKKMTAKRIGLFEILCSALNSFWSAAGKYRLHSTVSLVAVFGKLQVPGLNFQNKCIPLWDNCTVETILCY